MAQTFPVTVYNQSVSVAEKVGPAAEMPRLTSRQQHRSNAEAQTAGEYFQRNVAIPLLDHIIMCIEEQFSPSAKVATSLLGLVPSVLCSRNVNLNAAVNTCTDDLPSPELFEMELTRWRSRYLTMEPQLRPASPAVAIIIIIIIIILIIIIIIIYIAPILYNIQERLKNNIYIYNQ